MIPSIQLAVHVLVLSLVVTSSCETFYIVPVNSTVKCEAKPCLTLDQLPGEIINQNFSNLTLYFSPGQHFLNQNLKTRNIENVKITGSSAYTELWLNENQWAISKVENLAIEKLTFASSSPSKRNNILISNCGNFSLKECTILKIKALDVWASSTTMTACTFNITQVSGSL